MVGEAVNYKGQSAVFIGSLGKSGKVLVRTNKIKSVSEKSIDPYHCVKCKGYCPSGLLRHALCSDCLAEYLKTLSVKP
jgi:hypothetical protein